MKFPWDSVHRKLFKSIKFSQSYSKIKRVTLLDALYVCFVGNSVQPLLMVMPSVNPLGTVLGMGFTVSLLAVSVALHS